MESKLKCPICGEKMKQISYLGFPDDDTGSWIIEPYFYYQCENSKCRLSTPRRKTAEEAYEAAYPKDTEDKKAEALRILDSIWSRGNDSLDYGDYCELHDAIEEI